MRDLPTAAENEFALRALAWAARWPVVAWTTDNGFGAHVPHGGFPARLPVARRPALTLHEPRGALARLRRYLARPWSGGPRALLISYDFKTALDQRLTSRHPDPIAWPLLTVLEPTLWLDFGSNTAIVGGVEADETARILAEITATPLPQPTASAGLTLTPRLPRTAYLRAAQAVREDIRQGEVYELNLCQEFYAEAARLPDLIGTYLALGARSPTPFGGFWRVGPRYLLQASPERFCRLDGRVLRSQPIKGTAPRGATSKADEANRAALLADEKERAENLMIVDLVRNDLSRAGCRTGSVQVEELFGTYGFRHVWQMIWTVRGELPAGAGLAEVLAGLFPMGSMTGAPKRRATELIDQYESSRRGLYSGAVGWLDASGDFDLSVVIRSLQYRADTGYASFQVGSALTYNADPAREYTECLLKARALREILT
ncbi:MAG: anthranilate synthase component I family protein [Hymenobacteraceae bacterium]|nr:anthranilate synthase component I family protein [Hymenobacteraceae bacterium]